MLFRSREETLILVSCGIGGVVVLEAKKKRRLRSVAGVSGIGVVTQARWVGSRVLVKVGRYGFRVFSFEADKGLRPLDGFAFVQRLEKKRLESMSKPGQQGRDPCSGEKAGRGRGGEGAGVPLLLPLPHPPMRAPLLKSLPRRRKPILERDLQPLPQGKNRQRGSPTGKRVGRTRKQPMIREELEPPSR